MNGRWNFKLKAILRGAACQKLIFRPYRPNCWKRFQPPLATHLWVQITFLDWTLQEQERYEQHSVSQVQWWCISLSPRLSVFKNNSKSKEKHLLPRAVLRSLVCVFSSQSEQWHKDCSCEKSFNSGWHIASIAQLDRKWKDFRSLFDWNVHSVVMHWSQKGKRKGKTCPIPFFHHFSFCLYLSSFPI